MRQLKAAAVRAALSTLCTFVLLTPAYGRADEPAARQFDISPQSLATALSEFARQSQQEILFAPEVVAQKLSSGVRGTMQPLAALKLLLKDSALTFTTTANGAVLVGAPPSGGTTPLSSGDEKVAPKATGEDATKENHTPEGAGRKKIGDRIRVAQADQGGIASDSSVRQRNDQASKRNPDWDEEVVVTAQKRTEKLLDVPDSVSAISGERLVSLQVNSLTDLANYVPGMSIEAGGAPGYRTIVIRGLSTGYNNVTTGALVATYIEDLPVGDSTAGARGGQYGLDLNPYDIERIEVLKGPQGTLYGANAMGGLVKYSLRRPDLRQFEGSVGADSEHIEGSGRPSWRARGAVNVPIVMDKLAVRLSAFHNDNAGYIDNVALGTKHVNHSTQNGGQATLLWQPTDHLAVRAMILAQDINADNMTEVTLNGATLQPLYGPRTVSMLFPGPYRQKTRIYSLGIDWNLDFATLTSSTGWSRINTTENEDLTVPFGSFTPGHPDALAPFFLSLQSSKFVEEVRLTSPENQRIQWMLGGYYTKEQNWARQYLPTFTPSYMPLPVADLLY
jgi:iron complex outermembrane receptor protein